MKLYRILNSINPLIPHGYANGYVAVPQNHPLWGKDYDDEELWNIDVHGGLTYSDSWRDQFPNAELLDGEVPKGYWIFGFDTAHYGDNSENCDRQYCINEVTSLKEQLENYETVQKD